MTDKVNKKHQIAHHSWRLIINLNSFWSSVGQGYSHIINANITSNRVDSIIEEQENFLQMSAGIRGSVLYVVSSKHKCKSTLITGGHKGVFTVPLEEVLFGVKGQIVRISPDVANARSC